MSADSKWISWSEAETIIWPEFGPCHDVDCPGDDPCGSIGCWGKGRGGMIPLILSKSISWSVESR